MERVGVAFLGWLVVTTGVLGCSAVAQIPPMIGGDWDPPILLGVEATAPSELSLAFDEEVGLTDARIDPAVSISGTRWHEGNLIIEFDSSLVAGDEYWIDAVVEDERGNVSSLLVSFYGANPDLPRVVINEIVCEGSSSRPDWVELRLLEAGNVGGLTLYEGSPSLWDSRKTLPAIDLPANALIVVHFKPSGDVGEVDELYDPTVSTGANASPGGWDLWVSGGDGIPNSTGALTLTRWPGGPIEDAFLYTTKRYDAESEIRGFGLARQLEMFEEVVALGGWVSSGEMVIPEDGFDPELSTATRSISRDLSASDSDTALDWHIVPTSSASPGSPNTEEVHVP